MNHEKWEVLKSAYKLKSPYINVRHDVCRSLRGNKIDYYVVERAMAVAIVALTPERQVILERQYRHPIKEWLIEIPAGLRDRDESSTATVKRELLEETGYHAKKIIKLLDTYPGAGLLDQELKIYLGLDSVKAKKTKLDPGEEIEIFLVDFVKAVAMIKKGIIRDAMSIIGIYSAQNYFNSQN
ncbi:MAG: hypothetical protein A2445_05385 [Candidatus Jacksonbacteria bacterium RIFOXYC2_FULL_44_29]|nr:MAG: NUDIX hydrolase [Parcubacteria group bacterium GW2011_GWC2_44_22]OGY76191.1 MAG: hypothetical protein A2240_04885 [Candidatus Jacksonbacteria bacterium RIFOXYA2_FULL_43_12]OGY77909.1 MAG: hypothetical protein A2295_04555 [Candidatus Jacksonbacteria bacterium RIFOXYB2_FULL_44_15]OGY78709.1 MAG: hypothetical protein A2550_04285 [Candidatus Jacksonbacteria bacterium RIFOXYD2_FULL_43_21]OGY80278.1 MAG: hypothetical protein A2445_05385 [Candidatus Jacksonbacteria bacterium RIFOXYC2_FULL_44_2